MATSPTVRRRRLAAELRRLREAAGLTLDDAAAATEISRSTLSRIENAQVGPKVPNVRALLLTYGVADNEADLLLQLARQARERSWLLQYSSDIPDRLLEYLDISQEAVEIRQFNTTIPGLLQNEAYAREILNASLFDLQRLVPARLELRMARQEVVNREDAPLLWFILDEACLWRTVGSPEIMRGQLEHLIAANAGSRTRIQIIPFGSGPYPSMDSPFIILDFKDDPSVIYLESPASGLFLEHGEEVRRFKAMFDHMRAEAASMRESNLIIRRLITERYNE